MFRRGYTDWYGFSLKKYEYAPQNGGMSGLNTPSSIATQPEVHMEMHSCFISEKFRRNEVCRGRYRYWIHKRTYYNQGEDDLARGVH